MNIYNIKNTSVFKFHIIKLIYAIALLFVFLDGEAQEQLSVYKNLTTAYGLPSNQIYKIEFDEYGFLWIASPRGLIKYDGNNYKLVLDFEGRKHLPENEIHDFVIVNNNIWYVTKEGKMFIFNKDNCSNKEYIFNNALQDKAGAIELTSIYADSYHNIWLSVKGFGLLIINSETFKEKHIYHHNNDENSLISNNISDIYQTENHVFLLSSDKGFSIFNQLDHTFQNFSNTQENPHLLLSNNIQSIIQDYNGDIWLGYSSSGLSRFNSSSLQRVDYTYKAGDISTISNNYIHDLFIDKKDVLWVSTYNGLNCININDNTSIIRYQKYNTSNLSSNNINSVTQSSSGNIWVATNEGGISVIENSEPKFVNDRFNIAKNQYNGTPIIDIEKDKRGRIWFLSPNEGVLVYNSSGKFLSYFSKLINDEINRKAKKITSLFIKGNRIYFIGLHDKLFYTNTDVDVNVSSLRLKSYDLFKHGHEIRCVNFDKDTNLWVLTEKGAYCYKDNALVDSILTNTTANCVTQDFRGNMWIGTCGDGVWIYNLYNNTKKHFRSDINNSGLVGDNISYLYEDNTGIMWVGTVDGGLCKYDRNYNKFSPFKYDNRLLSSEVFSIIEDDNDHLWVATKQGLIKIDEQNNKCSLFGLRQGLIRNQYKPRAVLKDENGYLFFGTESGLLSFNPANVVLKKEFPELKFTDFFVFNKSIFSLKDTLKKSDFSQHLLVNLDANDNYIGIEYAALNLDYNEQIQYKYRLLGFEKEWIYCRNNNYVSYLNIPSGNYTFQLLSTNVDGVWNEDVQELRINISPPLYLRTWFFVLLLMLLLAVVLSVVYLRFRFLNRITRQLEEIVDEKTHQLKESNLKLKQEVEERRNAEESAEKSNKTKSLFLANMSHEIRTPMNSIIGFTDLLNTLVQDKKQRKYLDSIKKSGRSLLVLINDILDLSKIEAGNFDIQYQPVNVQELINEIRQVFVLKCDEKDLAFNVYVDPKIPKSLILSDARLRQVFINIVGNAVKFTDSGSVSIVAKLVEAPIDTPKKSLRIDIIDTGIGIAEDQQLKIFDVFQQQEGQEYRKYGGTGLGLNISKRLMELMGGKIQVKSKEGEGTTFSLFLNDVPVYHETVEKSKVSISILDMDLKAYSFLIVDDSSANRNLIKEFLKPSGVTIIEASNGQEAFTKAQELLPTLIFLDIRMPVMNGFETAKALKEYQPTKDIPLIAFTANVSFKTDVKYKEAGFVDVLLKPIQLDELGHIIQELLKISETRTEIKDGESETDDIGFENIQIVDLTDAFHELSFLLDEWEYVKSNKFINTILDFSIKIIKIGEIYSIKSIVKYGKHLQVNAYSFDTEKIEKDLDRFPHLIDELKSYLND